jgi:phosphatidylglycerophosphate synthase
MQKKEKQMFSLNDIRTRSEPVGNWSKWVIHPFSDRILLIIANHSSLRPNNLTVISFLVALVSAVFFYQGDYKYLIIGGLLYELSFALDAMDGTLARLKNMKSHLGAFIDPYCDIWKGIILSNALIWGQFRKQPDMQLLPLEIWFISIFLAQTLFYEFRQKASGGKKEDITRGVHAKINKIGIKNKLQGKIAYPFTIVEFQTIVFFIFPILNRVKIGLIFSSMIGTINMLLIDFLFIFSLISYEKRK